MPRPLARQLTKQREREVVDRDDAGSHYSADDVDAQPIEIRRVPADQIQGLTDEQKNEVFTKVITAVNPNINKALTRFNYSEGVYKSVTATSHLAVHFEMDSILVHVESDEAKEQIAYAESHNLKLKSAAEMAEMRRSQGTDTEEPMQSPKGGLMSPAVGKEAATETEGDGEEEEEDEFIAPPSDRALKNQFNFSERATQTFNNPLREREIATEPPPTVDFAANVTHWEIFDTYVEDLEKQIQARAAQDKPRSLKSQDDDKLDDKAGESRLAKSDNPMLRSPNLLLALKTMERLVNQNSESELYNDYKYYEDRNELKRVDVQDKRGSFLPLWKFSFAEARKKTVTAIAWNPEFTDLFAVGYGSYDFMKQTSGLICCYSLKNTQFPEYKFTTESGVMCLEFHPQHSALLVAGLYDGTVCVFDVRSKGNEPIYSSTDPKVKHTDPVWQVHWQKDNEASSGKNLNFYSVSSDGRVTNWIMNKNELINEEVIELKLLSSSAAQPTSTTVKLSDSLTGTQSLSGTAQLKDKESEEEKTFAIEQKESSPNPAGDSDDAGASFSSSVAVNALSGTQLTALPHAGPASLVGLAGGSCFDFNQHLEHLFIVGTEEGAIHLYSKAYNSQFLRSFDGHNMSVYSVRWNPFHPGVFLSCSADWTVKLWEINCSKPVMTFDLNCSIGDVAWSPYSATVFSVVASDGKIRVFDLNVNKHEPIGDLRVNKKNQLTHVAFNSHQPIVCVGDDRGVVNILKLSANLRKTTAPTIEELDQQEEIEKLDRLLIIPDREPGQQPAYLKQFYASQDSAQAGKTVNKKKSLVTDEAAPNGGSDSQMNSPKGEKESGVGGAMSPKRSASNMKRSGSARPE